MKPITKACIELYDALEILPGDATICHINHFEGQSK